MATTDVFREPATKVVFGSTVSVNFVPVASIAPAALVMTTVYSSTSVGLGPVGPLSVPTSAKTLVAVMEGAMIRIGSGVFFSASISSW